jgi:hypothetical protein
MLLTTIDKQSLVGFVMIKVIIYKKVINKNISKVEF